MGSVSGTSLTLLTGKTSSPSTTANLKTNLKSTFYEKLYTIKLNQYGCLVIYREKVMWVVVVKHIVGKMKIVFFTNSIQELLHDPFSPIIDICDEQEHDLVVEGGVV